MMFRFAKMPHLACEGTGYLWIDQICINQDDVVERTEQVSIMRDIFACADAVTIWPSMETEELHKALEILRLHSAHRIGRSSAWKWGEYW